MFDSIRARLTALALVVLLLPAAVSAQSAAPRPTYVAVPDDFPDVGVETSAVLMRTADMDVILLEAQDADPEQLAAAVDLLGRLRSEGEPPDASKMQLLPIVGFVVGEEGKAEKVGRMRSLLARLEHQPRVRIGNLGQGRWIPVPPGG